MNKVDPARCDRSAQVVRMKGAGHENLWGWFGLSYASWLTLPRVLMHEMPDDWQLRMAELLHEYDEAWDFSGIYYGTRVQAVGERGRITKFPRWLLDYRHPSMAAIQALRSEQSAAVQDVSQAREQDQQTAQAAGSTQTGERGGV